MESERQDMASQVKVDQVVSAERQASRLSYERRRLWTVWLAPFASAGLLYLAFFPVAIGWLGWVALVPWLCLVRLPRAAGRRYLAVWLSAVAFFLAALQW